VNAGSQHVRTFNVARTENLAANPAVDFCSIWNRFLRAPARQALRRGIGAAMGRIKNTDANFFPEILAEARIRLYLF
jgi:hypothetical protein